MTRCIFAAAAGIFVALAPSLAVAQSTSEPLAVSPADPVRDEIVVWGRAIDLIGEAKKRDRKASSAIPISSSGRSRASANWLKSFPASS